jgi:hypothetical protein
MRLVLHPKVYSDIDEIMAYYEPRHDGAAGRRFYAERRYYIQQAGEKPESFAIRERDLPPWTCNGSLIMKFPLASAGRPCAV